MPSKKMCIMGRVEEHWINTLCGLGRITFPTERQLKQWDKLHCKKCSTCKNAPTIYSEYTDQIFE